MIKDNNIHSLRRTTVNTLTTLFDIQLNSHQIKLVHTFRQKSNMRLQINQNPMK